ncbi:MAG: SMI1/KNR4 family protein, partial [Myxococcales bacterium]|nr:SMI1/KNR4 family protein [Myxococcales bacterium]
MSERIRAAVEVIQHWMQSNGAPRLAENLAQGASDEQLREAEEAFGVELPRDLRALWKVHNGQPEEGNGFFPGGFNWLSTRSAVAEQENLLLLIGFEREADNPRSATRAEVESDHWLPFAGLESDMLAVHGETGRVFLCYHDDSPELVAASLETYLTGYAARVAASDYKVKGGLGDYYLEERDRAAERMAEERAEKQRRLEAMPPLERFREALLENHDGRAAEVMRAALDRNDSATFDGCVALLFSEPRSPALIAGTLRTWMGTLALPARHWFTMAIGGAMLGNNAVRDIAISKVL